ELARKQHQLGPKERSGSIQPEELLVIDPTLGERGHIVGQDAKIGEVLFVLNSIDEVLKQEIHPQHVAQFSESPLNLIRVRYERGALGGEWRSILQQQLKVLINAVDARTAGQSQLVDQFGQLAAGHTLERPDVLGIGLWIERIEAVEQWQRL